MQHIIEEEKKEARHKAQVLFDRKRRKEQRKAEKEKKRVERARRLEAWRAQQQAKREKNREAEELREKGVVDVLQRRELDIAMTQEKERRRQEVKAAQEAAAAEKKAKEDKLAAREREKMRVARKEKALSDAKKKEELQETLKGSIPSSAGRFTLTSFARARAVKSCLFLAFTHHHHKLSYSVFYLYDALHILTNTFLFTRCELLSRRGKPRRRPEKKSGTDIWPAWSLPPSPPKPSAPALFH
jgi:hypothetical protein